MSQSLMERRRRAGISQSYIARVVGMSIGSLRDIELGKIRAHDDTLIQIEQVIDQVCARKEGAR